MAFELRLEPNDASRYEVALKDPGTGRVVWRSGSLAQGVRPAMKPRSLSLFPPAR